MGDVFKIMGVKDVFGDEADLSGIMNGEGKVDEIKQTVRISTDPFKIRVQEVSNGSSECSGIDNVHGGDVYIHPDNEKELIIFNSPFIFVIANKAGQPIVAGMINQP